MYLDWTLDIFGGFFMWFNFHFYGGMNKKNGRIYVFSVLRDLKLLWACYHVNETVERYQGFVY